MPTVLTLAMISSDVYSDTGTGHVVGYKRLLGLPELDKNNSTGSSFFGAAYAHGQFGVIAFRGSLEWADWTGADTQIAMGTFPIDQLGDAFSFVSAARLALVERGVKRIVVTGHSLGGGLTQLVAAQMTTMGACGVTFNAPGMGALKGGLQFMSSNSAHIYNYRAENDPVSLSGAHIGRAPVSIKDGGYHPIGPLVDALTTAPEGGTRY